MAKEKNSVTVFSKITPTILTALEEYMTRTGHNQSSAIRTILTNALRTEKLLGEINK